MDALYRVVTPDFLWSFHDGLFVTRSLAGSAAIAGHLAELKALLWTQRFHDEAYHHSGDMSFMTFRVSETVRATDEAREQRGVEGYTFRDGKLATEQLSAKIVATAKSLTLARAPLFVAAIAGNSTVARTSPGVRLDRPSNVRTVVDLSALVPQSGNLFVHRASEV